MSHLLEKLARVAHHQEQSSEREADRPDTGHRKRKTATKEKEGFVSYL